MKKLLIRSFSGVVLVGVIIAATVLGKGSFLFLCWILGVMCYEEFLSLVRPDRKKENMVWAFVLSIVLAVNLLSLTSVLPTNVDVLSKGLLFLLVPAFFIYEFLVETDRGPVHFMGSGLAGAVYTLLPFQLLAEIGLKEDLVAISPLESVYWELPLAIFIFLWTSDSGAYCFGSLLGKNKLIERISPGKTIEGLIGGILTALITAWILSRYFQSLSTLHWIIMALIVSVAGVFGDLSESRLKRYLGVKDSGNFIPGHGGFLDRFDSLLFAAPAVYFYLSLI